MPSQVLAQANAVQVQVQYQDDTQPSVVSTVPYLKQNAQQQGAQSGMMQILPVTSDNVIASNEQQNSLVVRGQYVGQLLNETQKIVLSLDGQKFDANLDKTGVFSTAIPAESLVNSASKQLVAEVVDHDKATLSAQHRYTVDMNSTTAKDLDIDVQPLAAIDVQSVDDVEISGKVIKPYSSLWLYFAIIVDNLASGLAGAAFIAFLSSLTSVSFTAVQYAIFSSLMTLTPKILGGYSGTIVTNIGYPNFFLMTTLIGIPILILVVWVAKLLREHQQQSN